MNLRFTLILFVNVSKSHLKLHYQLHLKMQIKNSPIVLLAANILLTNQTKDLFFFNLTRPYNVPIQRIIRILLIDYNPWY